MAKIWLTSDQHYSHRNTLRYCGRPFFTLKHCTEAMIARHNEVVSDEDTVYHLGDFAMHHTTLKKVLPRLKGKHVLIVGNHDLINHYFLKTRGQKFIDKMVKEYTEAGFKEIYHRGHIIPGSNYQLCHFPTKNTYDTYHNDMHNEARPEDVGILNICGHIHEKWVKRGNNINIGVDVWNFTPVDVDIIIELYYKGPTNIDTPYKLRNSIWKIYHTLVWRLRKLFRL